MADIDTSSYQNKVLPLNPLDTYGKAATLQGALNQNKLFQQQFQTNKAVSDIYKRAVRPDGTLDMDAIRDEVSKNPAAAYGLEQVFKGAQGLQQGQIATDTAQLENKLKHIQAAAPYFARVAKPGSTSRDVLTEAANALTNGVIDVNEYTKLIATLPKDAAGKIDESKIPGWARQRLLQFQDLAKQLEYYNPKPEFVDLPGGGKAPFQISAGGGVNQVGDTIQAAPPPNTTVVGPDGTPRYVGAPQGNNPYEARYQQSQAGNGLGPQGGAALGGGIAGQAAGLSPAASAAMTKSGGDSAEQLAALRSEVGGSANRVLQLQNASTALEGALTGKGSQTVQDWRALLVTSGAASEKQAESVKNFDEAKKYMLGSMLSRGAGLGINTNEKLSALSGASPNTDISKLAAKDILRTNIGLEQAQQGQYKAFEATGLPPEQFASWAARWNTDRDLRAYPLVQKPPAERTKFINSLKPGEKTKLLNTLREAVNLGVLPLSDFAK